MMVRKKERSSLGNFRIKLIHVVVVTIVVALASVLLLFHCNGNIPTGTDLEKSDWLSFSSGFLSFVGSVIIAAIAIYQNRKAEHQFEKANNDLKLQNEELAKQNRRANELMQEMVLLQNAHFYPIFSFVETVSIACYDYKNWNKSFANSDEYIDFELKASEIPQPNSCIRIMGAIINDGSYSICGISIQAAIAGLHFLPSVCSTEKSVPVCISPQKHISLQICIPCSLSCEQLMRQDFSKNTAPIEILFSCTSIQGIESDGKMIIEHFVLNTSTVVRIVQLPNELLLEDK